MSPEWLCRRVWKMLLAITFPRVFTVLALSLHVSRVALQEGMDNALGKHFSSCFHGARAEFACLQTSLSKSKRAPDTNLVQLFDITIGTRTETYRKPLGNPQETIRKPT
jgi:hypothetical protein